MKHIIKQLWYCSREKIVKLDETKWNQNFIEIFVRDQENFVREIYKNWSIIFNEL